jgi:hypothetical protein
MPASWQQVLTGNVLFWLDAVFTQNCKLNHQRTVRRNLSGTDHSILCGARHSSSMFHDIDFAQRPANQAANGLSLENIPFLAAI